MVESVGVVAVLGLGAMGSAVASRMVASGVDVVSVFEGRSAESRERAEAAGVRAGTWSDLENADVILSIVPPSEAPAVAATVADIAASKPGRLFVDCNAVSPQTMQEIARLFTGTRDRVVDAGIIGGPPKAGARTVIYTSGPDAEALSVLGDRGLDVRVVDGPIGAASALKMSYAGITKGLTALGAAMMLAATRADAAADLAQELRASQPQLLAWLIRSVPSMLPKAYRFDGEMSEIADFIGEPAAGSDIYEGMALLYRTIATDSMRSQNLTAFVETARRLLASEAGR
ncbi:MAG: NAD(P)-binding domain-containing protein [Reyranellaceae bacterium]